MRKDPREVEETECVKVKTLCLVVDDGSYWPAVIKCCKKDTLSAKGEREREGGEGGGSSGQLAPLCQEVRHTSQTQIPQKASIEAV